MLISISLFWSSNFSYYTIVVVISAFFGNIVDSLAGVYETAGIGNKYTSNVLCGMAGALLAMLILLIV